MNRKRQAPVSLAPLEPEDALAGLLQVKPEQKESDHDEQGESVSDECSEGGAENDGSADNRI